MENQFETNLADQLNINEERIAIINVERGSIKLDININDPISGNNTEPSTDDLLSIIHVFVLVV